VSSLRISHLRAGYGTVQVLEDVSLEVGEGETVALLGTNGNGKSTLINAIIGLVTPAAGSIVFGGRELAGLPPEAIVGLGVAIVPEGRQLCPKLTVEENLLLGAWRKAARPAMQRNLAQAYDAFPRLAERRRQLAGLLSGGEQQMLALGRALMAAPKLLLIDEPSVGLAPLIVNRMIETIRLLKERYRLTVLMAEQNFPQAMKIADRGYVLVHGRIAHAGSAAELADNALIRKFYLGL
jgi:branched-chain amino acid transport system ATP-binding protein